jgi:hypothetical protein
MSVVPETETETCILCHEEWDFRDDEQRVCFRCRLRPLHVYAIAQRQDSDVLRRKALRLMAELAIAAPEQDAMDDRIASWVDTGDDPTLNPGPKKLPTMKPFATGGR